MSIEFQINQVIVKPREIEKSYSYLLSSLQSYLPAPKTKKRRTRRNPIEFDMAAGTIGDGLKKLISMFESV